MLEDGKLTRGEPYPTSHVYIDGLLPDVGPAVLRDRRRIGEDGICFCVVTIDPHDGLVGEPVVTQKGVVFADKADDHLEAAKKAVESASWPASPRPSSTTRRRSRATSRRRSVVTGSRPRVAARSSCRWSSTCRSASWPR